MYLEMKTFAFLMLFHRIIFSSGDQSTSQFGFCLQQKPSPGIISCVGRQALTALQRFEESDNFTITQGLVAVKDETGISRSLPNFVEQDPTDLRGMLENAGVMVSQRSLQWDLSRLYPGLQMKIGPSYGSMGVLEFIMDKGNDLDDRTYLSDEPSTARILTKQFVLPFLLGLKFNIITLLPILIAAIIFVSKKAAFLGKLALVLSGLFSTGTLFSLGSLFSGGGGHDNHFGFNHKPLFHGGYKEYDSPHHHQHHNDDNLSSGYYKNLNKDSSDQQQQQQQQQQQLIDKFYDYEKKILLRDRISKLYEREINDEPTARSARQLSVGDKPIENQSSYRNFAWQTQQN